MPPEVRIIGIECMPEFKDGDDLAGSMMDAAEAQGTPIQESDILVITQKIISKVEGKVVNISDIEASPLAISITEGHRRDPRHTEWVLRESKRIVWMVRGVIISETKHGFYCANAGIDASNIPGDDTLALLPDDSDASALAIRQAVKDRLDITVAVIVSDTFGRPWRNAAADVAIGVAGIDPVHSYVGQMDSFGHEMFTTEIAVVDELAAAGELVGGKVAQVPVSIIRGYDYQPMENASIQRIVRGAEKDLFR